MSSFYEDAELQGELQGELGAAPEEDLQFEYLFEYEPPCSSFAGGHQDDPNLASHKVHSPDSEQAFPLDESSPYKSKSCSPPFTGYDHPEAQSYLENIRPAGLALSPRIEITPSREHYSHGRDSLQNQQVNISPRPTLTVPGQDGPAYREPQCLSPASSNSSASWHSESFSPWASPCVSPGSGGHNPGDLCPRLQNIHTGSPRTSPGASPRASLAEDGCLGPRSPSPRAGSRSASPQGKRTYQMYRNPALVSGHRSRSPSPHGGHEDPLEHHYPHGLADGLNGYGHGQPGLLPTKIVKTSNQVYTLYQENHGDGNYLMSCEQDGKAKPSAEPFFVIPPIWPKPLVSSICSIPVASLPPLEWPIPSSINQYELRIEMQPKPHHRAHYETEGSRGAVKAPTGGHPVVQLHGYRGKEPLGLQIFIGTADERVLKPHAFYQVHRITGKTVTTTSFEKVVNGTKVLEIPLEPKNNMKAIIDCAGILKLRNADIELRKGETDVGRKNTRVRLVFRVHVPQPGGQHMSLQVASHPIECSQRSAHELPMVEKQDMDGCSVLGGQQMILTGQNFSSDSKVVFLEKTQDGQQIWEVEATVDKDKSQPNMLFLEVPSYRDASVCHSVKVNFYVINGKRKRSQPQHFTYTPLASPSIKTEPIDEYESEHMGFPVPQIFGLPPHSYYQSPHGVLHSDNGLISGMASCQRLGSSLPGQDARFRQQSSAIIYSRGGKNPGCGPGVWQTGGVIPEAHCSVLVHTGSPAQAGGPVGAGQHPSIIQFSPTNQQLLRAGDAQTLPPSQPATQQVLYCDEYPPQGAATATHLQAQAAAAAAAATHLQAQAAAAAATHLQVQAAAASTHLQAAAASTHLQAQAAAAATHLQAQAAPAHPQPCPTVIQQQPYVQKEPQKGRAVPGAEHVEAPGDGQRTVTVKEENLDQAYLDDVNEIIRKDLTGVQARGQT
ncbi:nuclear factor of activated T-cells, cytoplasmic 2 isoform X2 [Cololabis saira]|uniref:nuclear factor of activated T-cells, cytoplasmic 2 isoform X2 n=1 Tax=Cololabis saira TaxID=129043 RepID=UPI002AD23958|nr:nuclear factor of activated T-cells, cytoplasmic 2 isoform X2 [Cololabis saira]